MKARTIWTLAAACAALLFGNVSRAETEEVGALWENLHVTKHVKSYEGSKSCLGECHEEEAIDVFKSIHYQWKAQAPNISNAKGRQLGKINTSNDFCTNSTVSWIGILTNNEGKLIGNGCTTCHIGLGKKPEAEMSPAQLENIDCLICHAANYRREVVKKPDGTLAWQPKAMNDPAKMLSIAQNVIMPTNRVCMRCHVSAGGGLNFKRGDIETKHAVAEREFDVHMGSNMQCIQCHKFKNHEVLGAGTQMAGKDQGDARVQCENCHKGRMHAKAENDKHGKRLYCTTCHIPSFARHDETDVRRDWSQAEPVAGEGRFEPKIEFASNVKPVYAWWNGTGEIAMLNEPIRIGPNGKVGMYTPNGSRKDAKARIYPFKYHTAKLPIDNDTQMLIPVQVGPVFKAGNIQAGVKGGAKAWFGRDVTNVGWVETERYMGLFHEVQPSKKALDCADCHQKGSTTMDWKALGYAAGDPAKGKISAKDLAK